MSLVTNLQHNNLIDCFKNYGFNQLHKRKFLSNYLKESNNDFDEFINITYILIDFGIEKYFNNSFLEFKKNILKFIDDIENNLFNKSENIKDYFIILSSINYECNKDELIYSYKIQKSNALYNEGIKNLKKNDIRSGIYFLKESGELGNHNSYYVLGEIYEHGRFNVDIDLKAAFNYYELASNLDNTKAINKLANFYDIGEVVERDIYKAYQLYKKASLSGEVESMVNAGYLLYKYLLEGESSYKIAYDLFIEASKENDERAFYYLYKMYKKGLFVDQDLDEANKWLRKYQDVKEGLNNE